MSGDSKKSLTENDLSKQEPIRDEYYFGGIKEFNLEQIEAEVLNENVYLDVFAGSDLRIKENIQNISKLSDLMSLDVVAYDWKETALKLSSLDLSEGPQVGVIAQQVAAVFPELVKTDKETGVLQVNYSRLSAQLLLALKEMQQMIVEQEKTINQLKTKQ